MQPRTLFRFVIVTTVFFLISFSMELRGSEREPILEKQNSSPYNAKGTPAKITDSYGIWTDFNLRTRSDADVLRKQIGDALFEQVANNCNETSGWPGAISSYAERNKVREQMLKYVCYQIGEIDSKWILRVPASENGFLPYGVRPEHDIFFILGKSYVELTGSPSNINTSTNVNVASPVANNPTTKTDISATSAGTPAKINGTGGMYSTFNLKTDENASLILVQLGNSLFNDVVIYCKEDQWPSGIATLSARDLVRDHMNEYKAYKIAEFDKQYILRIPASENKFMPSNMQLAHDIYFIINQSDVTLTGTSVSKPSYSPSNNLTTTTISKPSIKKVEDKPTQDYSSEDNGKAAQLVKGGYIFADFDLDGEDLEGEVKDQVGSSVYANILQYSKSEKWPSGIATYEAREANSSKIPDYKVTITAHFYDYLQTAYYVVKITPEANKHMPANMRPTTTIYLVLGEEDVVLK